MSEAWLKMEAHVLGQGIAKGEIDPVLLTEAYLAAIHDHPQRDRIYARTTEARAMAEARSAQARALNGTRRSALDGVPISWKDLFDTAGIVTEAGSALLKGRVPASDAKVLAYATAAGLICLGKTHMTELAFSGLGLNPVTASPPNINDEDAVSGGSSSGAATSVAHGLAVAGIGSDTGGSVRNPAAWNDLVGLKTRTGTLSLDGVVPLATSFDTVGPLARSVTDAALLLAAMGGPSIDLRGATLAGTKLAVLKTSAFENLQDAPRAGFESAVERLQAAGAEVERIEVAAVAEGMALAGQLFAPEAYGEWGQVIEANPDVMFGPVRERFRSGRDVSADVFVAAWRKLNALRVEYAAATAAFDAVLIPTVPILPPKQADVTNDHDFFVSQNLLALQNTRIGNLMGLAGVTLPTGVPSTGILLQGPDEGRLLRLAKAAEAALA